ncbi:hypothetical protein ABK040_008998 [Willaertia magna]
MYEIKNCSFIGFAPPENQENQKQPTNKQQKEEKLMLYQTGERDLSFNEERPTILSLPTTEEGKEVKVKLIFGSNDFLFVISKEGKVYMRGVLANYNFDQFTEINSFKNKEIEYGACGENFTILIDKNNTVYYCGIYNNKYLSYFEEIYNMNRFKIFGCGTDVIYFVTLDNSIVISGNEEAFTGKINFVKIGFLKLQNYPMVDVKDLQCGFYHSILLDNFGSIYGTGRNLEGQLGLQKEIKKLNYFTKIKVPFKVKKISCFSHGTFLINFENEIYASGKNRDNQLGIFENCDVFTFTKIKLPIQNFTKIKIFPNGFKGNILAIDNYFYVTGKYANYRTPLKEFQKWEGIGITFYVFTEDFSFKEGKWEYLNAISCSKMFYLIGSNYKVNRRVKRFKLNFSFFNNLLRQQRNEMNLFLDIKVIV